MMTQHNGKNGKKKCHRVIALLNREQVDCLDVIGKDALFSTGAKLARTEIIGAMVNVLKALHIDASNVSSAEELEMKIMRGLQKNRENVS